MNRAAILGMKLEWTDDGVKTIMGPIPAVKWDESRGRKIWFNSMAACDQVLEEECVAVPWRHGDILLIDNWAVLHSRRSFEPPRRILASLCK
jgi:hypothetical protein